MLIVHVRVHVKNDFIESFKQASIENARNSLNEPGIVRFDLVQSNDDPARFVLNEVYRTAEAATAHKETAHYKKWRDEVEEMMAEPRFSQKFTNLFPLEDNAW